MLIGYKYKASWSFRENQNSEVPTVMDLIQHVSEIESEHQVPKAGSASNHGTQSMESASMAPAVGRPPSARIKDAVDSQNISGSADRDTTVYESLQVEQSASANDRSIKASVTIIVALAGINFLNTMGSGILISALPRIAKDIGLSEALLLWPASVYALAAGCFLLIFGAVADIVGAKLV